MRNVLVTAAIILIIGFEACNKRNANTNNTGFRKNIKVNHLYVVIDDSTYKYLFDSLKFLDDFARKKEDTVNAGSESWSGKYLFGKNNYLEIFKPGGMKGAKLGNLGLGFMTNKYGTVDSLQQYWTKTLDSVHVENKMYVDNGKSSPWFKSLSIPDVDSLKVETWVMENTKEEMIDAGFTEKDLTREIEFAEYLKHRRAISHKIPLDSVKDDKLFDRVISLKLSLSGKELSYLRKFLCDIGFTEKENSFSKDDFIIAYSVTESAHCLLKEIGFSLLRSSPRKTFSVGKIKMNVDGDKATMIFNYD